MGAQESPTNMTYSFIISEPPHWFRLFTLQTMDNKRIILESE